MLHWFRFCCWLGVALYALAALGLVTCWRRTSADGSAGTASEVRARRRDALELCAVGALGLLLALGPVVSLGGEMLRTPLFPFYEAFSWVRMFRVPVRAFALTVAALAIGAGAGWLWLRARIAGGEGFGFRALALWIAALLWIAVENVPFPLPAFAAAPYAAPPASYTTFLDGLEETEQPVLLELPSAIGYGGALVGDLFHQNRELIYMNWQTYHRRHVATKAARWRA